MLRRTLCLLLVPTLFFAACGGDDDKEAKPDTTSADERPAPDPADQAAVEAITISEGVDGKAPQLDFDKPFEVGTTVVRVLRDGDGRALDEDDLAIFDFVFVNGRDGKEIASSYAIEPAEVIVNDDLLDGLHVGLTGLKSGSQALIAVAPADAFAGQGDDPESGVNEDDTLLIYVDLHDVRQPLARAEGKAVKPVEGLPTVTLDDDGKPTVKVPDSKPPAELTAQTLIEGTGAAVEAGQTVTVHYTALVWESGDELSSTWGATPPSVPIDSLPGWEKGLVGRTVGSQVLLVIPAGEGYPSGTESIPDDATLVFVIDILDARG